MKVTDQLEISKEEYTILNNMNKLEPSKAGKLFPKLFAGGEFIIDHQFIDASPNKHDE